MMMRQWTSKLLLLLGVLILLSTYAGAQEIRGGLLLHDIAPVWGNQRIEKGLDVNAEIILGKGLVRPNMGFLLNLHGDTNCVYAGVLVGSTFGRCFGDFAVGGELVGDYTRKLGSPVLFRIAGEIGYMFNEHLGFGFLLHHVSNANIAKHNAGVDVVGFRVRYIF